MSADELVTVTLTRGELEAVREAASAGFAHLASTDFAALNRGMLALERPEVLT